MECPRCKAKLKIFLLQDMPAEDEPIIGTLGPPPLPAPEWEKLKPKKPKGRPPKAKPKECIFRIGKAKCAEMAIQGSDYCKQHQPTVD